MQKQHKKMTPEKTGVIFNRLERIKHGDEDAGDDDGDEIKQSAD